MQVLEAHIVSVLGPGVQHLVLIGDHLQLRPKANDFFLDRDVSVLAGVALLWRKFICVHI